MTTRANALPITEKTIEDLSARENEPEWLRERRLTAWRVYEQTPMPDPRDEEWRRTDISYVDFDAALSAGGDASVERRSGELPEGVIFGDLQAAGREHEGLVKEHLHSLAQPGAWKLAALQAAGWQNGTFLYVPANVEVRGSLELLLRQDAGPFLPHLLVVAEANSSVTLVQEVTGGATSGWSLLSGAVEIVCKPDARVRFIELQDLAVEGAVSFTTMKARVERGGEVATTLIGLGGRLAKTTLEASLAGEGARAELIGVSLGGGKQHFDYQTLQDHIAPRTTSDLLFKAALDDESSNVWHGTVRIHKGAGQSEASQTSRNLLLSDHAKAAPIPVLEIEAYDVLRCAHGATAGPVDAEQLFYLESRGIAPAAAESLLVEAFFREVVDRIPDEAFRDRLMQDITAKIGAVS